MEKKGAYIALWILLTVQFTASATANLSVGGIFSDNMVLQQGIAIPIWGRAIPKERITIKLATKSVSVVTDANGRWSTQLPPFGYGGPYILQLDNQYETIKFNNVMIGEVWLASGQSNMAFTIGRPVANMKEVVAEANYPMIREFNVAMQVSKEPKDDLNNSNWKICSPQTVIDFSAVCYFFARDLYLKKKVAIGIIQTSWAGTPIEAWLSKEGLLTQPDMKDLVAGLISDTTNWAKMQAISKRIDAQRNEVIKTTLKGLELGVDLPAYVDTGWKRAIYPITATAIKAPFYSFVWFRKTFDLPANAVGGNYVLQLGNIMESNISYFNGKEIGRSNELAKTIYTIPQNLIKPGKNVIAIRLLSQWGNGQLGLPVDHPVLQNKDKSINISLGGEWRYNTSIEQPLHNGESYQNRPTALFNAMINPLVPYAIKGFLWYQGEANAGRYKNYEALQTLLIKDWRNRWGEGDIPFLFVQLPNLHGFTTWPWMREQQSRVLATSNTGMAVTIDVGDHYNIHPQNKEPVGERLALLARNLAYHERVTSSGPTPNNVTIKDDKMIIQFKNIGIGMVLKDTTSDTGFEVAGNDHLFHPASLHILGDKLIISSSHVAKPIDVRYAWDADPKVTLYNIEGLPAAPFRTDTLQH